MSNTLTDIECTIQRELEVAAEELWHLTMIADEIGAQEANARFDRLDHQLKAVQAELKARHGQQ